MGRGLWIGAGLLGLSTAAQAGSWDCTIDTVCEPGRPCESEPFSFRIYQTDGAYRLVTAEEAIAADVVPLSQTPGVLALTVEDQGRSVSLVIVQPDGRLTVADVMTRPGDRAGQLFRASGTCTARP